MVVAPPRGEIVNRLLPAFYGVLNLDDHVRNDGDEVQFFQRVDEKRQHDRRTDHGPESPHESPDEVFGDDVSPTRFFVSFVSLALHDSRIRCLKKFYNVTS